MNTPVVTLAVYQFTDHKYWAFKQMREGLAYLKGCEGLEFYKLLGTGAGNGFSIWPNFGQYACLFVWENRHFAEKYFLQNPYQQTYEQKSGERKIYWLRPVFGHGYWDGVSPFSYISEENPSQGKIAVLTRASIRWQKLLDFWQHVPGVSAGMTNQPGLQLAMGVGEWPLIQQATFSIWENLEAMKTFAYKQFSHHDVVKKTRERNWYKEELFARFQIIDET